MQTLCSQILQLTTIEFNSRKYHFLYVIRLGDDKCEYFNIMNLLKMFIFIYVHFFIKKSITLICMCTNTNKHTHTHTHTHAHTHIQLIECNLKNIFIL